MVLKMGAKLGMGMEMEMEVGVGPHRVAECPKCGLLNALRTNTEELNGKDDHLDNTERGQLDMKNVKTKVGTWEGNLGQDDFNVVLGLNIMVANQVISVPTASCVMFYGDHPGVLAAMVTSKVPCVRGDGVGAVDEDVDKLGGGQSTDGWADPQATSMCFRHTIEAAPTARVDGVNLFENKANLSRTRPRQVSLDLVAKRTKD
ncbi:hypothetical protein GQ457_01G018860 [Hibiscus cannabinus]